MGRWVEESVDRPSIRIENENRDSKIERNEEE